MLRLFVVLASLLVAPIVHAEAPPTPTFKLISAGKAPQKALRFTPVKGAKTTFEVTEQNAVARGLRGKLPPPEAVPTIKTVVDIDVTDVKPDGDIAFDVVYRKAEAVADKRAGEDAARAINATLSQLAGTKGHALVTNRGVAKDSDLTLPTGAKPDLQQQLAMLKNLQSQIVSPLPEEAVGVGARWQSSHTIHPPDTDGTSLTVEQSATFELVEISGTRGKIALTLKSSGKSKDGKLTMKTTGKGELSFDLSSIGATSAKLDVRTEVELAADGKKLAQLNTSAVTFTSKPR